MPGEDDLELRQELSALRDRVTATEAVLAIHALKAEYGELVDRRFALGAIVAPAVLDGVVRSIAELFTEDGVWDGGPVLGTATGRDEIASRLRNPSLIFSRHLFLKPRIAVDYPLATARWDLLCPCKTADGRSWWMCGYEDDEYRFEQGVWLHTKMVMTAVFMSPAGEGFERILI